MTVRGFTPGPGTRVSTTGTSGKLTMARFISEAILDSYVLFLHD